MAVHGSDDTKPLVCKECGKRFLNNSALACHSKVHAGTGNDPNAVAGYDCPICGTPFDHIHSLKEHVHVHRDLTTGMYSCPHCQKVCIRFQEVLYKKTRFYVSFASVKGD